VPESAAHAAAVAAAVASRHDVAVGEVVIATKGTIAVTTSGKARRGVCRERYLADRPVPRPMEVAR
jgi:hypothetical protein